MPDPKTRACESRLRLGEPLHRAYVLCVDGRKDVTHIFWRDMGGRTSFNASLCTQVARTSTRADIDVIVGQFCRTCLREAIADYNVGWANGAMP